MFCSAGYAALTNGVLKASVDVEDVHDLELQSSLISFVNSPTVGEAQTLIANSNLKPFSILLEPSKFLKQRKMFLMLLGKLLIGLYWRGFKPP